MIHRNKFLNNIQFIFDAKSSGKEISTGRKERFSNPALQKLCSKIHAIRSIKRNFKGLSSMNSPRSLVSTNVSEKIKKKIHERLKGNLLTQNNTARITLIKRNLPRLNLTHVERAQEWWDHIEKKAGYRDDIPVDIIVDLLVNKKIANNRINAKKIVEITLRNNNEYVQFEDFKALLHSGVFTNALKDGNKRTSVIRSSKLGDKVLITNLDNKSKKYKQGILLLEKLKKDFNEVMRFPSSSSKRKLKPIHRYSITNPKINSKDYDDMIRKYKERLSTNS